jgi:hypothetical protein
MATETTEDLITQAEAARLRGVTRSAIAYLVAQGRLRTYERFGVNFVSKSEVENYEPMKPGPVPKLKADETANRAAKKKAISRWENEGGATPKGKKKGGKK